MTVHDITSKDSFKKTLEENPVVFVDFFATWCAPCKAIAPLITKWSDEEEYSKVHFGKVDIDDLPDIAQEFGISAVPTFVMFRDGEKVADFKGAMPQGLLKMIQKNVGVA